MNFSRDRINLEGQDQNKCAMHLFYSRSLSFENFHSAKGYLRTLVIIGHCDVTLLSAVSELIQLQELWIVECGIKEVPSFKKNCLLERLYLYTNEIEHIPNLKACTHLRTLSLSGNNISKIKNLSRLTWIQEVNLAGNKLSSIGKVFSKRSELDHINLAGNNLRNLKDIRNVALLPKLSSIAFADPLYGECPLVFLCNYRSYIISCIPRVKMLDHYPVCKSEKHWVNHFFKKQIQYYNMLLHKELNLHLTLLREKYKEYKERMLEFREQLYGLKTEEISLKHEHCNEFQSVILKIEVNNKRFTEWREMLAIELEILRRQLTLGIDYCGNISFVEYNMITGQNVIQLCQRMLEESLCSTIRKATNIKGVRLCKVTKVVNKEIDEAEASRRKGCDVQLNMGDMILKIIVSPCGVRSIHRWPFGFISTDFFNKNEIVVTDCLAVADAKWLYKTVQEDSLKKLDLCQKQRICILVQTPTHLEKVDETNKCHTEYGTYLNSLHQACAKFKLTIEQIRNPIFVIQYEYTFDEPKDIDLQKHDSKNSITVSKIDENNYKCLSESNIMQWLSNVEQETHNLVKVCVSGQNINTIDEHLDLPNLIEFDVSYNQLTSFPNSKCLRNTKILNLSFNKIETLCSEEILPKLEHLDVSWNSLVNCFESFQALATFIPKITKLNVANNPFKDIIEYETVKLMVQVYLPNLQFIDNVSCNSCINTSTNYYPCALSMCQNAQRKEFTNLPQNVLKNAEKVKAITHIKDIHVSRDSPTISYVLKEAVSLQELCAACSLLTKLPIVTPLKYLTKLNLGSNFISTLDGFTQTNLPKLKYLDLTNNLITTLQPMGSFETIQEFYCSHNKISSLMQIDNLKTWRMLYIIDLCNNPIDKDLSYEEFITFHLNNIGYISGEGARSDIHNATCALDNVLNKNILYSVYNLNRLTNITQLSIVDCSLKKVDLSPHNLPALESLDLSRNQITIPQGLHSFQHLQTLCLSHNRVKTFDEDPFEKDNTFFPSLCTLFLDHNHLKSLENIFRKQYPVIRHLFLNQNYLQNINELKKCSTLETLVLDHNKIEILNEEDFQLDNNIKFLSVENNTIKSLEFAKLLEKLESLYIADNFITKETELQCLASLKNLQEITFQGNPLTVEVIETATNTLELKIDKY